jgi:DNA modification methylase
MHLLIRGDARRLPIAVGSVDCVVTSPPYWQQRDYQVDGQIGLEADELDFVSQLVGVFSEVRRVLRADGCVFVNLGETFNAYNGNRGKGTSFASRSDHDRPRLARGYGLTSKRVRNKSIVGVPWRFALAMIDDGWILRSEIIWDKAAGKPERVVDRPTRSHEHVFLFTTRERYFWSGPAVRSVWTIPTRATAGRHTAKMAVNLAARCIRLGCPDGGTVLDPFSGFGTTGVAANALGRRYLGVDLSADYLRQATLRIDRPHSAEARRRKDTAMPLFAEGGRE